MNGDVNSFDHGKAGLCLEVEMSCPSPASWFLSALSFWHTLLSPQSTQ